MPTEMESMLPCVRSQMTSENGKIEKLSSTRGKSRACQSGGCCYDGIYLFYIQEAKNVNAFI